MIDGDVQVAAAQRGFVAVAVAAVNVVGRSTTVGPPAAQSRVRPWSEQGRRLNQQPHPLGPAAHDRAGGRRKGPHSSRRQLMRCCRWRTPHSLARTPHRAGATDAVGHRPPDQPPRRALTQRAGASADATQSTPGNSRLARGAQNGFIPGVSAIKCLIGGSPRPLLRRRLTPNPARPPRPLVPARPTRRILSSDPSGLAPLPPVPGVVPVRMALGVCHGVVLSIGV